MRHNESDEKSFAGFALAVAIYCLMAGIFLIYLNFLAPETAPPRVYVPQASLERLATAPAHWAGSGWLAQINAQQKHALPLAGRDNPSFRELASSAGFA